MVKAAQMIFNADLDRAGLKGRACRALDFQGYLAKNAAPTTTVSALTASRTARRSSAQLAVPRRLHVRELARESDLPFNAALARIR